MDKLKKWLADNGFNVSVKMNDYFAYDSEENTIWVGKYREEGTESFPEFLNTHGCDYAETIPLPMLAFLHELGHFHTIHAYSQVELLIFDTMKESNGVEPDLSIKERAFNYWLIPDEMDANMWEIKYLMNEDNFPALNDLFEIFKEIYA